MDIVHTKITFEDTFSKAKEVKTTSVSKDTFNKMLNDIGKVINYFDKVNQIHWNMKIIKIEQI
jgi:Asp-tRNA(Asn)/Glu-tRNA(Gln) amidotransferase C subunit